MMIIKMIELIVQNDGMITIVMMMFDIDVMKNVSEMLLIVILVTLMMVKLVEKKIYIMI